MDTKEIKTALKAAREAIRNKEFKDALKHCKAILKTDKGNYNALVFVGVAAEGLDQADQAMMAYKKATEVAADNPLAWQGLCGFYEKSGGYKMELVDVLVKLQSLYSNTSDQDKWTEVSLKLAAHYMESRKVADAHTIYRTALGHVKDGARTDVIHKLVAAMERLGVLSDEQNTELLQYYQELVNAESMEPEMWTTYLMLLRKCDVEKKFIQSASRRCHEKCPRLVMALENLARILLDESIQDKSADEASSLVEKFSATAPDSGYIPLLSGLISLNNQQYTQARDKLKTGLDKLRTNISGWFYLCQSLLKIHAYLDAYEAARQGLLCLGNTKITFYGDKSLALNLFSLYKAQAGVRVGQSKQDQATDALEQLTKADVCKREVGLVRAELCLVRNEPLEALKILKEMGLLGATVEALITEGRCHEQLLENQKALELYSKAVAMDTDNAIAHYWLGRLMYETRGENTDLKECLIHLLKAAKLDPYYTHSFLYLGKYYEKIMKDIGKASRCYQKSFDLDSSNDEAGSLLIDSLITTEQKDQAVLVLKAVTGKASAGCAKWAWLRLGLHQMTQGDHTDAIVSLQSALRADNKDVHCWECLGDAYFTRGSYTAALKAFTRATELDPSAMFCYYQMATIKQALGAYDEAVSEYKHILSQQPDYVPALKGLGETYLMMARAAMKQFFHGRAVDCCQMAINHLARAATARSDLSCLWKLIGDACTILNPLPNSKASMLMPSKLITQSETSDDMVTVTKMEILATGAKSYGMALKQQPDSSSLWHDLGVNYHYQSQLADKVRAKLLSAKAMQCVQKAVRTDPANHKHWLTLGVIAACGVLSHLGLAQHCFIKSIQVEANNVQAWTNLGALYLSQGEVRPAHEAFSVAQSLEPDYVQPWIGQALIAEAVGDSEAMDLFRHTTELGTHVEGAVGYGHWVCQTLLSAGKRDAAFDYAIRQMAAVPAAADVLSKYLDRVTGNPIAYNLYGLLLEKQGLYSMATSAFQSAVSLYEQRREVSTAAENSKINLARSLCLNGQPQESVEVYKTLKSTDSTDLACGYGLALYKAGNYAESILAYEQALTLTEQDADKSHIQAAIGMVAHRLGDVERTKAALFEGFRLSPPSVEGLEALLSVGLLQHDTTLSAAVLEELQKLGTGIGEEVHTRVEMLAAEVHVMSYSVARGRNSLQRAIHCNPSRADHWCRLAEFLMRYDQDRGMAAHSCTRKVEALTGEKYNVEVVHALSSLSAGYHSDKDCQYNALSQAQKAVHSHPDNISAWFSLLAALYADSEVSGSASSQSLMMSLTSRLMALVETRLSQSAQNNARMTALHVWCVKQYILVLLKAGRTDQAKQFLEQAAWLYDSDPHLQGFTAMFQQSFPTLKNHAKADNSGFNYQMLISLYLSHGLVREVEKTFHQWLTDAVSKGNKLLCLAKLSHFAFGQVMEGNSPDKWFPVFEEACSEVLKIDALCSPVLLMRGILTISNKKRFNLAKRTLHRTMEIKHPGGFQFTAEIAKQRLIQAYEEKGDVEAIKELMSEIKQET